MSLWCYREHNRIFDIIEGTLVIKDNRVCETRIYTLYLTGNGNFTYCQDFDDCNDYFDYRYNQNSYNNYVGHVPLACKGCGRLVLFDGSRRHDPIIFESEINE